MCYLAITHCSRCGLCTSTSFRDPFPITLSPCACGRSQLEGENLRFSEGRDIFSWGR